MGLKRCKSKAETVSTRVLYALVGMAVVLFGLFYLVGFSLPYWADPVLNAPLFTGALVWFMLALTVLAIAIAVVSVVQSVRHASQRGVTNNHVPARKIAVGVALLTLLTLIFTAVGASSAPLLVNDSLYTDAFWLKAAGMFVSASLLLILFAALAVAFGATRYYRKSNQKG